MSNKYPTPVVGGFIYNSKDEILLIKNNKWGDVWSIPGGHVEIGESMEDALKREIKEETGLDIGEIKFISVSDGVDPQDFYEKRHFVFINYLAKKIGGKETKSDEMEEYKWVKLEKALKLKLSTTIIEPIKEIIRLNNVDKEDWEHKYKLALADYQNLIKQHNKDKEEFVKYSISNFVEELIPVYDHLKMSLSSLSEEEKSSPWVQGVEYVLKQFKDLLKGKGIEEIKTIGEKFDHNTMEAIEGQGDKVKKEVMAGYKLNGRVIKPARVIVE